MSTSAEVVQLAWQSQYGFYRRWTTRLLALLALRNVVLKERSQQAIMEEQETMVMWLEDPPNGPQAVFLTFAAYS